MGGQNTKSQANIGYFSAQDVSHFKTLFNSINRAPKNSSTCTPNDFQRHCEKYLDDWLALKLAEKFTIKNPKGGDQIISIPNVIYFLSCVLLGNVEEKVKSIWEIALSGSSETRDRITVEEISQYAQTVIKSYLKCMELTPEFRSWNGSSKTTTDSILELSDFLLADVFHEGVAAKETVSRKLEKSEFTIDDLCRCFSSSPLLLNLHSSVFSECFDFDKTHHVLKLIPHCLHVKKNLSPEEFTIQDITQIIFINSQLPSELRKEWRYLFTTTADGESFSKMLGAMQDRGSTVFIVKDDSGTVFGAFADESWAMGPKFFGSEKSFLFHLNPKLIPYASTGFNKNFQYLNLQQQTMPNGLGMGGKLEYFGLWLDSEFGKGKCAPTCTTYASPQLSSKEEFNIHTLEVWGVGPEPVQEEGQRDAKSILDKNPEAKAILELMNKAPVSDGYRDKKKAFEEDDDEN